jgi:hypothetical protein
MIAKRSKLSRITVAKYLTALQADGTVEVARIGKALAWRVAERKPTVGIIAKTGTARMVQLALGDLYAYTLATTASAVKGSEVIVTDNARIARSLGDEHDVILIGASEENSFGMPELFEAGELAALVRKLIEEQEAPDVHATACIAIEHIEDCEEVFGFQGAEELITLTRRLLEEHRIAYVPYERTYFLIEGTVPEDVLADIEQTFHTILAHLYGEMVTPGEEMTYDGVTHMVPALTMTLATPMQVDAVEPR